MALKMNARGRVAETSTCIDQLSDVFSKSEITFDPNIACLFPVMESKNKQLVDALNRIQIKSVLEAKDDVQDDAARALNFLVVGACYNPNPEVKAAAMAMRKIIDHHGMGILRESYRIETAMLKALIADLNTEEVQGYMATIDGCAVLFQALVDAHSDFDNTLKQSEADKVTDGGFASASVIKDELVKLYNGTLADYFTVMAKIDSETYGNLDKQINQIVADYNSGIDRRRDKGDIEE